jgi:hypothetical protein
VANFWDGTLENSKPGPCRGLKRVRIGQPAAGRFAGEQVDFGGTAWEVEEVACGARHGTAYVLDHFNGTLDPERHGVGKGEARPAPQRHQEPTPPIRSAAGLR